MFGYSGEAGYEGARYARVYSNFNIPWTHFRLGVRGGPPEVCFAGGTAEGVLSQGSPGAAEEQSLGASIEVPQEVMRMRQQKEPGIGFSTFP